MNRPLLPFPKYNVFLADKVCCRKYRTPENHCGIVLQGLPNALPHITVLKLPERKLYSAFSPRRYRTPCALAMRPCSKMIFRCAWSPTSMSCVTTIIVLPESWSFRKMSMTISSFFSSRFPVGSSASNSFGLLMSARAIQTRCCSPPESWFGK